MSARRRYPSDLSDARWALIEPTLNHWREERLATALGIGRPPEHDLRTIMDANLYVDRTGIPWRYLPHDFPPYQTVYSYFARWQADGVFAQLTGLLRTLVRQQEGRRAEPSACITDSQTVKTSADVPRASQGTDVGKKIVGRKQNIITDSLGLLLAVLVTAASVPDSAAGRQLLTSVAAEHPGIIKAWSDSAYRTKVVDHAASLGIDLETVRRDPATRGFVPLPKRWIIERTFGWLMFHRRLARDYETLPERSQAMIHIAMIDLMTRRLTGESTVTWRGTRHRRYRTKLPLSPHGTLRCRPGEPTKTVVITTGQRSSRARASGRVRILHSPTVVTQRSISASRRDDPRPALEYRQNS